MFVLVPFDRLGYLPVYGDSSRHMVWLFYDALPVEEVEPNTRYLCGCWVIQDVVERNCSELASRL